ncbi:MAG: DsbA family oxidoreductase [Acidimicrobiia bacterium]|nr:DsbA family oxidoreductase [Acidimicrobiia bacterium]
MSSIHAPREPGDLRSSLERKYGPGSFDLMTARLGALGTAEGIEFRFDRALRVNTFDAHRLLAWAADEGLPVQNRLADLLFSAYFEDGENVADRSTLRAAAVSAGLDGDQAARVLDGDKYEDEVSDDLRTAVDLQVTGVPAFFVGESLFIPGAQEVKTMVALLDRVHDRFGGGTS